MNLHALNCHNCGGLLKVPEQAKYVTCTYCGSQLAVKESEGVRFTEAIEAIHDRLDQMADQKDFELLDQEWAAEQKKYLVQGQHGQAHVPDRREAWLMGIVVAAFGCFWSACAFSMGGPNDGFGRVFPLFGLIFAGAGIGMAIIFHRKAVEYEAAQQRYFARRKLLMDKQRAAVRSRKRSTRKPAPKLAARWADQDYSDLIARDESDIWTRK